MADNQHQKSKSHYTRHIQLPGGEANPARQSIHVGSVQICDSAGAAGELLGGDVEGFAYVRNGHANEYVLAERCEKLHQADFAALTPSGMAALSLALLSVVTAGDHVVVSRQLYGTTLSLFSREAAKFGIESSFFDATSPESLQAALRPNTRLILAETISNPLMQVVPIGDLAKLANSNGSLLLIDNTFASPALCRPLDHGAHLVMESLTKIMNGHSDVLMGLLCGRNLPNTEGEPFSAQVDRTQRQWGLVASPFECWLADRGLGTLELRIRQACRSAARLADLLEHHAAVCRVNYPGMESEATRQLCQNQFQQHEDQVSYGYMLSFELSNRQQVDQFVARSGLLFCPSLGDIATTLSYPATTSHRGMDAQRRTQMGISDGLVRISVGIEPTEQLVECVELGLAGLDDLVN